MPKNYTKKLGPKNNLKIRIKTEPVTVGANATEYVGFMYHTYTYNIYVTKALTDTDASALAMMGSISMRKFRLFLLHYYTLKGQKVLILFLCKKFNRSRVNMY